MCIWTPILGFLWHKSYFLQNSHLHLGIIQKRTYNIYFTAFFNIFKDWLGLLMIFRISFHWDFKIFIIIKIHFTIIPNSKIHSAIIMIATIIYWVSTLSPIRLPKKVNIENTLIKYKSPTQRITTIIFSNIFNNLLFIFLLFFVQFLQIFSQEIKLFQHVEIVAYFRLSLT